MKSTSSENCSDNPSPGAELIVPKKRSKILSWSSVGEQIAGSIDLLLLILVCLPASSIVRFTVVRKQWRYLLTGYQFPLKYVSRNPKPPMSGLYYGSEVYPTALQGHSLPKFTFMGLHERAHRMLHLDGQPGCHFYLSFDPSISLIYKLIYIRSDNKPGFGLKYYVDICASNLSFWINISLDGQQLWGDLVVHGVLASDGVVYMLTTRSFLVQFDIETQNLSAARMTYEPKRPRGWMVGYFGEHIDGHLVLIGSPKLGLDFMVYQMDKIQGRIWVQKYHVNLTAVIQNLSILQRPILRTHFAVMRVFWDVKDEESDLTLVIGIPGKVIPYNQKDRKTEVICDLPGRESFEWDTYRTVHPFIGSLCTVYT